MAENAHRDDKLTVWDGLGATLIHDIGKLVEVTQLWEEWRKKGNAPSHSNLERILPECFKQLNISGEPQVPNSWYGIIGTGPPVAEGKIKQAHKLGDRISKQIQGQAYSQLERDKGFPRRDQLPTAFYPYFGSPLNWDSRRAELVVRDICQELSGPIDLSQLLRIQRSLRRFPHSRYVPHLSLAIHDLFAAALFYFAYRKLKESSDASLLGEFTFWVIEVTPDLLDVFYRLRDVIAGAHQADAFYKRAAQELFGSWETEIPGLSAGDNPFVFYNKQGFAFLYPDFQPALTALGKALADTPLLRTVTIRGSSFCVQVRSDVDPSHFNMKPGQIQVSSREQSLHGADSFEFVAEGGQRCEGCQRAADTLSEDDKRNLLCRNCADARRENSGVDLDLMAHAGSKSNRLAFMFLTLPDLHGHAAAVAEKRLIPDYWADYKLPADRQLPATEAGIYEYLQALMETEEFDARLAEAVDQVRKDKGQTAAAVLFLNPSSKALVSHEEYLWDLLESVYQQRQILKLECSVRIVVCSPRIPFWSLIDMATEHTGPHDVLWDVSRGTLQMFSDTEVRTIRDLAKECQKANVRRHQLESLSNIALQTTLEELLLEVDARSDRLRELRPRLLQALRSIAGEDYRGREKRAVFLKYVASLTR